ncbi:MAG: DHH family phosphoesterase [archaeon]|nr:DHH family phosphoesterase [archaeon]
MDGYPDELSPKLVKDCRCAADALRKADSVYVVTHIDADGITSGAIASETLKRLGKRYEIAFEKKITDEVIDRVNKSPYDLVWICDLGSAYMSSFTRTSLIVTDHHEPDVRRPSGQTLLDMYLGSPHHLNPHLYGVSGSFEVCGAGMTYLLSKTVDPANRDLAHLAVIGALGDFQDTRESKLVSYNRIILQDAISEGDVSIDWDLRYFGRCSRSIIQYLQYADEPSIPGVSGNRQACLSLLSCFGIPYKGPSGKDRPWADLDECEKAVLMDAIMEAVPPEKHGTLIGEMYSILRYPVDSGLRDGKEFATVLNSCGRYDNAPVGARICLGDVSALKEAEKNRKAHSKNISVSLKYIKDKGLLQKRGHLQFFDAGSEIKDTVVGIVAGMLLASEDADHDKPMIAFAEADDGIKVSARATKEMVDKGLNLSVLMAEVSEKVGGMGGGHTVAAGATIPEGSTEEFLRVLDEALAGLSL